MRCFVIDDEPLARKGLKEFIEQTPKLEFIGEINNPIDGLSALNELSPDLLFLDIQMPKISGIDFVKQFRPEMAIIYTTAYSQYAAESYDLDVEDYLLKPIQYNRFVRAVGRVHKKLMGNNKSSITGQINEGGFFFVKSDGGIQRVRINEILYLKSIQNYVKITLEDSSLIVHQTLKSFEGILPSSHFMKVQKSYIINKNKVDRLDEFLLYFGKEAVPISRTLVKRVKQFLLSD